MYGDDKKLRPRKPAVVMSSIDRIKLTAKGYLTYAILSLHDFWIYLCDLSFRFYCALIVKFVLMFQGIRNDQLDVLYAVCNTAIDMKASEEAQVETTLPRVRVYQDKRDITYAIRAYYHIDTVLSCFTLQEWLKRFGINAQIAEIIFKRNALVMHSRLDLNNDREITTNTDGVGTSLDVLPGAILLNIDATTQHDD